MFRAGSLTGACYLIGPVWSYLAYVRPAASARPGRIFRDFAIPFPRLIRYRCYHLRKGRAAISREGIGIAGGARLDKNLPSCDSPTAPRWESPKYGGVNYGIRLSLNSCVAHIRDAAEFAVQSASRALLSLRPVGRDPATPLKLSPAINALGR